MESAAFDNNERTNMTAEERKDKALEAVSDLFSDTSVSKRQTLEYLDELASAVDEKRTCLQVDIDREERE